MRYVLAVCVSLISFNLFAQQECELKKEKDGIKISACPVAGSDVKAIHVEFDVTSTPEKYISIVTDIDNYKLWRYREKNHRLVKKISDHELIYYTQISAPFPVSDRDLVSHLTIQRDSATQILTVVVEAIPDYLPEKNDFVRVPKSKSVMKLTPLKNNRLHADCFIEVDPGGQIPAWVVNSFSTTAPYETFRNLIQRMEGK